MKFIIDPMATLRAEAEKKVDAIFNVIASCNAQRDVEHAAKRLAAKAVLAGDVSDHLEAEAALAGTTPEALAALILSKPDDVLDRGLQRRRALLAVRGAKTPAEIDASLKGLGA